MPRVSQEHLDSRRQQILDGARSCFARFGYEGATVRRLEEATGLSRGAIFHHFRDKDALFLAVASVDAAEMAATVAERGLVGVMQDLTAGADKPEIAGWLDGWPTPFATPAAATEFFGHEAWSRNLEQRPDGWYPRVDRATMLAAVPELATTAYWPAWTRVGPCAGTSPRRSYTSTPCRARRDAWRPEARSLMVPEESRVLVVRPEKRKIDP